jgi:hypothetical protein
MKTLVRKINNYMKKFILKRIKKKYKNIIIPTGVTVLTAGRLFYYSFDKSDDND